MSLIVLDRYKWTFLVTHFSVVLIQVDCLAATAMQLLLKLKRHLKIVYSLDDARCQVKLLKVGLS